MKKKIEIDLFDPDKKDNQEFVNLLDEAKWAKLIKDYNQGLGLPLDQLLEDMLEGR